MEVVEDVELAAALESVSQTIARATCGLIYRHQSLSCIGPVHDSARFDMPRELDCPGCRMLELIHLKRVWYHSADCSRR